MSTPLLVAMLTSVVVLGATTPFVVGRERGPLPVPDRETARRDWRARARAFYAEARWVHDRASLVIRSDADETPSASRVVQHGRSPATERLMLRDRARHLVEDLRQLEGDAPGSVERDAVRQVASAAHATSRALQAAGAGPDAVPPGRWSALLARFRLALDGLADALPRASRSRPSPR